MKYCTRCLYPETKPSLRFNSEGICSACQWYERKQSNNFYTQNKQSDLIDLIKSNKVNPNYDCIIPVSGGKDSTYQVWKIKQLGLNPLCVTAPTDLLTDLGRQNLENCKNMGVDHIEFTVNKDVRKKINRYALETVGDIQWPEHVLIFTIPIHASVMFEIPIIIWGENSVREYGAGRIEDENFGVTFDRQYLEENCGFNGLRVTDLIDCLDLNPCHLALYEYPESTKVENINTKGIFLDDYFPWNGMTNQFIAQAQGFTVSSNNILGTLSNSENLDNYFHGIHDYLKFLKYGFSRSTDMACNWIRRGLLTREEAIKLIEGNDGIYPFKYLDKDLEDILSTIDMSVKEFDKICDDFTNYSLFETDANSNLVLKHKSPVLKHPISL